MFNQLFSRSDALTRQLSAPLVEERRQYLAECASQGMSRTTLRAKSLLLLSIVDHLKLGHRPKDRISLTEIKDAARRWSRRNLPSEKSRYVKDSRAYFTTLAVEWLTFLNRFRATSKPLTVCDRMLTEFTRFMSEDRGLSPKTVEYRCRTVQPFLDQLLAGKRSLATIAVADVDSLLLRKVNEEHYARISIRAYASSLRSFFRYAEMRGWCPAGIAASIMAPRVFQDETLPSGPTWDVVQEILDATAGDHPTAIRDHAILMLLAVYGVRSREIARLRLSDINLGAGNDRFHAVKRICTPPISAPSIRRGGDHTLPQGSTTEIAPSANLSDEARAGLSSLEWRNVGDRCWPTAQEGSISQASRAACNPARLCNPFDQPRILFEGNRRSPRAA